MTSTAPAPTFEPFTENQESLQESRTRATTGLTPRERVVEATTGGGFVAAALAMALFGRTEQPFDWGAAAIAVLALAAASRVEFEVGASYTMPIQLLLVPMLFLVPPTVLPICVAVALIAGKLPQVLLGRRPLSRLPLALGDSWFAVGPALVFLAASPGAPDGSDWPIYLAALAAQFVGDFTASIVREGMNGGASPRQQLSEIRWVHSVDAVLAPAGLAVAFAATGRPWILLLVLPLVGLIAVFARERRARMDYVLELSRAYRGTATVLGNVVEADDAYTGMHCEEVVVLAVEVAEELKLRPMRRRNVEFGALLHDVGKIAVPKSIINKPGPLDDEEWAIMRRHTIEGQQLLDQIGGFMADVGTIVRASHERFDGGGYPDGLAGEDIPLEARIVCCCDAFNAMTTDRAYRKARSAREALDELRACSGTHFDPAVVVAVVAVVERRLSRELDAAALLPDPVAGVARTVATG